MGDRDDKSTNPDQENVMFRILNTLEEGQRMQQEAQWMKHEHNRKMDMRMDTMLQLMARQMGININPGDANNGKK